MSRDCGSVALSVVVNEETKRWRDHERRQRRHPKRHRRCCETAAPAALPRPPRHQLSHNERRSPANEIRVGCRPAAADANPDELSRDINERTATTNGVPR